MLAIVEAAKSIRGAVQYNEEKVKQEQARFLDAHNFLQEKEDLTIREKLGRFRDLTSLNERSKKHCIHISVNFPPKDELSDQKMKCIARDFMQAIDFGDQPWLLYRHVDVGHPHMHIVTTNIRSDGSRISNDHRAPHFLKQTCFQLEDRYHLSPMFEMPDLFKEEKRTSESDRPRLGFDRIHESPARITYGERPTRTAIGEVLEYVNRSYWYTSFEGYNAVLSLYNVRADRGREGSAMYQNKGLYYRLIDEEGKKLGAPIKASDFNLPVTWDRLEEKYKLSEQPVREAVRSVQVYVNYVLAGDPEPYSLELFRSDLIRHDIELITPALRYRDPRDWQKRAASLLDPKIAGSKKYTIEPDDGHGFFYLKWSTRAVIRDTDAGKDCSAANVLQRTGVEKALRRMQNIFRLSDAQKAILDPAYPDKIETRRLLLRMAPQHDNIVQRQLELKEEQELEQRHSHRMRHGL